MASINTLRRLARTTQQVNLNSRYATCMSKNSISRRIFTTEASPEKQNIAGSKGHGMLAPFTAGWHSSDLHPLIIAKSEGSYVYDDNGKKYLDSLAGLWCTALGGSEPRLVSAALEQLNTLPFYHSFWNRTTKPSLDLAKDLLDMFTANKMAKAFLQAVDQMPTIPRSSWFGITITHLEGLRRKNLSREINRTMAPL